jgi:hypothetical protein
MRAAADSSSMSAPENLEETQAAPASAPAPTEPTISPAQPAQPVYAVPPIAAAPAPAPAPIGEPVVTTIAPVPPVAAPVSPAPAASAPEPVASAAAAASVAPAPGAPVSIAPKPPDEDEPDPPIAAQAEVDDGPLLTIEVWQLGVLVLGLLVFVAHFVAGTPLPGFSGAAKFRLAVKLVGVLGALLLLLALRKRQQAA